MNKLKTIAALLTALFFISCGNPEGMETKEFTVHGNCGMCKKTIEGALADVDGLSSAEWDMSTDKMTVNFDPKTISLADIHKKIAAVGYDTEDERASDAVYEKLHSCCKYDRPE